MMKFFAVLGLFIGFAACYLAPHPYPDWNLNKTAVEGDWYVIFDYNPEYNNTKTKISCYKINFHFLSKTKVQVTQEVAYDNERSKKMISNATVQENDPNWVLYHKSEDETFEWITFNTGNPNLPAFNATYGTIASVYQQNAKMLSRTPLTTILTPEIDLQVELLQLQGYALNSTNVIVVSGQCVNGTEIDI